MALKSSRIVRECKTVEVMISLYCRHHHNNKLCPECAELTNYALERLQKCPFHEGKTICSKCPVHCYKPEMRERIRKIMRFSGPQMSYRHPILAIFHFLDKKRSEPVKSLHKSKYIQIQQQPLIFQGI